MKELSSESSIAKNAGKWVHLLTSAAAERKASDSGKRFSRVDLLRWRWTLSSTETVHTAGQDRAFSDAHIESRNLRGTTHSLKGARCKQGIALLL